MLKKTFLINRNPKKLFASLLAVLFLCIVPFVAVKAVFISPLTVVFQDKQVATTITVNNRGDTPRAIKLSWERRTMTEDGEMVKLEDGQEWPGYRPADPYIKFSPRQFILQPKRYQKVRMIAMRPADMEPGEYRSHLLMEERPVGKEADVAAINVNNSAASEGDDPSNGLVVNGKSQFGGQLILNINKSTPVFLLHGPTHVDLSFSEARLVEQDGKPHIDMKVENKSTRSIYAQLEIDCKKSDGQVITEKATVLRLYPEAKHLARMQPLRQLDPASCQALSLRAVGYRDFELDDKVLAKIDVQ